MPLKGFGVETTDRVVLRIKWHSAWNTRRAQSGEKRRVTQDHGMEEETLDTRLARMRLHVALRHKTPNKHTHTP